VVDLGRTASGGRAGGDVLADGAVRRAFAAVLRRHGGAFDRLAAYDRGEWRPRKR
jgi:hypothetical protein